ncbi:alpha-ketoglutarate-dependent dioxygenase alkB homolog 6 [Pieris napi]|uniref:alpha-ketoglutarate-dependent dioxygenase alkB homolog 6 n=1 Tax=Pieris napi TaxID=78633 RepID=UPI001FBAA30E|nr:alpha-ketoglutarate-dependent dioxygenase alkB homolog 6 [Pieris napi]
MHDDNFLLSNRIRGVDGTAYYVSDFITEAEEKNILSNVYGVPKPKWTQLSNRRLQNWGGIPHNKGMIAESIPIWLSNYLLKIDKLNLMNGNKPNHILVNEYTPGQGILPHLDGFLFYPTITTISLASHAILNFYEPISKHTNSLKPRFSFLLEPRSLLILQDKLFSHYLHGIEDIYEDIITDSILNLDMCSSKYSIEKKIMRETRISLTIRHVPKTTMFKINIGKQ